MPDFCNGRQLRDYQLLSLEWNVRNWIAQRNCILGDEVGDEEVEQQISRQGLGEPWEGEAVELGRIPGAEQRERLEWLPACRLRRQQRQQPGALLGGELVR